MIEIVRWFVFFIILIPAIVYDIKSMRIPNRLNLVIVLIGACFNLLVNGLAGLMMSINGLGVGFISLFLLYLINGVGGGDVKFFAAAGSLLGATNIFNLVILTLLIAGLLAIILITIRTVSGSYCVLLAKLQINLTSRTKVPLMLMIAPAALLTAINTLFL